MNMLTQQGDCDTQTNVTNVHQKEAIEANTGWQECGLNPYRMPARWKTEAGSGLLPNGIGLRTGCSRPVQKTSLRTSPMERGVITGTRLPTDPEKGRGGVSEPIRVSYVYRRQRALQGCQQLCH